MKLLALLLRGVKILDSNWVWHWVSCLKFSWRPSVPSTEILFKVVHDRFSPQQYNACEMWNKIKQCISSLKIVVYTTLDTMYWRMAVTAEAGCVSSDWNWITCRSRFNLLYYNFHTGSVTTLPVILDVLIVKSCSGFHPTSYLDVIGCKSHTGSHQFSCLERYWMLKPALDPTQLHICEALDVEAESGTCPSPT
jgi:hypothetical protein